MEAIKALGLINSEVLQRKSSISIPEGCLILHNIVMKADLLENQDKKMVLLEKLVPVADPNAEMETDAKSVSLSQMNPLQWFYIPKEEE